MGSDDLRERDGQTFALMSGERLDTEFVQSVLARISYKPGWSFTLSGGERLFLFARCQEQDPRAGGDAIVPMVRRWPIDWPRDDALATEAGVVAWVRHAIHEWEVHESNEWLMLDGERIHDPHVCPQCLVGGCRA